MVASSISLSVKGSTRVRVMTEYADQRVLAKQRNAEHRAIAGDLLSFPIGVFRILQDIGDVDRATLQRHPAADAVPRPAVKG